MGSEIPTTQPLEGEGSPRPSVANSQGRGADVMLISKQYKWSENCAWYQDASRRGTPPRRVLSRPSKIRLSSLRKALVRLVGRPSLWVTLIESSPSGEKPALIGGEEISRVVCPTS